MIFGQICPAVVEWLAMKRAPYYRGSNASTAEWLTSFRHEPSGAGRARPTEAEEFAALTAELAFLERETALIEGELALLRWTTQALKTLTASLSESLCEGVTPSTDRHEKNQNEGRQGA